MSHFAELDADNHVIRVTVGDSAMTDQEAYDWLLQNLGGRWVQTSYNGTVRKNYAGIGYTYDEARDAFIPPQPYPSWLLDEATCRWVPPVPRPVGGGAREWDEATRAWLVAPHGRRV